MGASSRKSWALAGAAWTSTCTSCCCGRRQRRRFRRVGALRGGHRGLLVVVVVVSGQWAAGFVVYVPHDGTLSAVVGVVRARHTRKPPAPSAATVASATHAPLLRPPCAWCADDRDCYVAAHGVEVRLQRRHFRRRRLGLPRRRRASRSRPTDSLLSPPSSRRPAESARRASSPSHARRPNKMRRSWGTRS